MPRSMPTGSVDRRWRRGVFPAAALHSIAHHDTGKGYPEFLTRLAQVPDIETPTHKDLA